MAFLCTEPDCCSLTVASLVNRALKTPLYHHQVISFTSVCRTALHITLTDASPFLTHPLPAYSPLSLTDSTGVSSGPSAFPLFIFSIAAAHFLLTHPLQFLSHQLSSIQPHLSHSLHPSAPQCAPHLLFICFYMFILNPLLRHSPVTLGSSWAGNKLNTTQGAGHQEHQTGSGQTGAKKQSGRMKRRAHSGPTDRTTAGPQWAHRQNHSGPTDRTTDTMTHSRTPITRIRTESKCSKKKTQCVLDPDDNISLLTS